MSGSAWTVTAIGLGLTGYCYLGYPVVLGLLARRHQRRMSSAPAPELAPSMTVVIAALNEEQLIADKLRDTWAQDYGGPLEIVVVADGSSDRTAAVAAALGVRVLHGPVASGKSAAVNRGVAEATTELICLTDANCSLAPGTLRALAERFMDPRVAIVSGVKTVTGTGARGGGEGLYWRVETFLKERESVLGTVMGAPGEVCALRRSAFRPIPPGVLNDDYHLTCDVLRRGWKVVCAPQARTSETVSESVRDELERRTRIAAGTWQTTLAHLGLADPRRGWVALAFISHRVLRNIVVPMILPGALVSSAVVGRKHPTGKILLLGQASSYALGLLGFVSDARFTAAPFQFLLTNLAQLRGGWRYMTRRQPLVWRRATRGAWTSGAEEPAGSVVRS